MIAAGCAVSVSGNLIDLYFTSTTSSFAATHLISTTEDALKYRYELRGYFSLTMTIKVSLALSWEDPDSDSSM